MMKTILSLGVVAIVAAVACPTAARAQSAQAKPVPHATKLVSLQSKSHQKRPVFPRLTAAQRGVAPSDLVAVTTPNGEKRYVRKKKATK
ncbi:MAG: hypothetical protein ACREMS_01995 [Gemmatimonadaceae bacterium]